MYRLRAFIYIIFICFSIYSQNINDHNTFSLIGNGYTLTNEKEVWLIGQIGYTKFLPTNYEGKYHWQFLCPRLTYGYNFLPWLTASILVDYDLLLVRHDINDFQINRHELLITPTVFTTLTPKIFLFGIGASCNNRFFLSQKVKGTNVGSLGIIDPISNLQIDTGSIDFNRYYEKYLIYLSIDVFSGIKIRMFKPYIDYKLTVHKHGFFSQISAGLNLSFWENRITFMLADIIKFYQPDLRNYIHANIGYTIFTHKKNIK